MDPVILHTGLYGAKDYVIVKALIAVTSTGLKIISKESNSIRYANKISFASSGSTVMDFTNEVLTVGSVTEKKTLKTYAKALVDSLERNGFYKDEKVLVLPLSSKGSVMTNRELCMAARNENERFIFSESRWMYPMFRDVQITLNDIYDMMKRLDSPDISKQLLDPFQLERRRLIVKDFLDKLDKFDFSQRFLLDEMIHWLAKDNPTVENWRDVKGKDKFYKRDHNYRLSNDIKIVEELGKAALAVKELEWVDPAIITWNRSAYAVFDSLFNQANA